MSQPSGNRYAVLLCAEDSEYVKKKYGGYFGVFVKYLSEEGDSWDVYHVATGELPTEEEIKMYDGFVITGSCNDAHGDDPWICRLMEFLQRLDSLKKKVLGICFGHQVLCRALGGKVGRAKLGWDIGVTNINLSPSSTKLFSSLQIPTVLSVIECHRDEVLEAPPEAEILAWSGQTGIEICKYREHMMGIQGHPEYTKDILLSIIERLLQRNFIVESYADEVRANVEKLEPDREEWKKLCTNFLKGKLW
ncbi:PREDICTED: gamma-glutamyl peptidase 5-like [Tarenaya hassleriana]|uniref:gamma-glutamyl peptidase 5-like n=1 Tax=Tarenaya hassleriana TaxID=28532 RepID=UPI00053C61F0|nr:PREDICTED: gamma-glutamyl peptidase 5-like [Tarenaya hassleriana]